MAAWGFTDKIPHGQPITVVGGGGLRRDLTNIDDIVTGIPRNSIIRRSVTISLSVRQRQPACASQYR